MSDDVKLTKRARDALARMKQGATLHAEIGSTLETEKGEGFRYWFEPSGRPYGPRTALELIKKGAVVPQRDGLLPNRDQSWHA